MRATATRGTRKRRGEILEGLEGRGDQGDQKRRGKILEGLESHRDQGDQKTHFSKDVPLINII